MINYIQRTAAQTGKKYISPICSGEHHPSWKGKKVGYMALHSWVRKQLGSANHCEVCGLDKIPEGKKKYFQWANISKKYKRDLVDWKQLCYKCHKLFDKKI